MNPSYSSDSSDSENGRNYSGLDFSYLMMDTESIGIHLRNSIMEQQEIAENKWKDKKEIPISQNRASKIVQDIETELQSVKKKCKTQYEGPFQQEMSETFDHITEKLYLQHNLMLVLPFELTFYTSIKHLDISNNNLSSLNDFLTTMVHLETLYIKNNSLDDSSLPKDMTMLSNLRELNLSGNRFKTFPSQLYKLPSLKYLYLGSNEIEEVLPDIKALQNLQVLNLGGNQLKTVPAELGDLPYLGCLILCDNHLRRLPRPIARLTRLRTLLLHKNNFCCLPAEIVKLRSLKELSIRDNPLVTGFVNCCVKEIMYSAPSLLELAARVIKLKNVKYEDGDIPHFLDCYLNSGQSCVNPKCKGLYFTSCIEHVKLVDFCGVYRVPLMHYLCSSRCFSNTPAYYRSYSESESDEEGPTATLKKILLG